MSLPIMAVVGRPNVGKSTFVNRIAQADEAIVHEMRGVTRDRSYHIADWNGVEFKLIDTGGIEMGDDDAFQGSIRTQAFAGVNEADVIVFIVDGRTGINVDDEEVARILRKTSKPVFLCVNKMDNPDTMDQVWEFYQLGLGDPWAISSVHGNGTGDLLDAIVEELKKVEITDEDDADPGISIAIIGRPNAGEYYGFVRAMRAIDRADVALLVIDGSIGLTDQDQRVAGFAADRQCAMVIVLNKWDLVEGPEAKAEVRQKIEDRMTFVGYAPVVATCALTGKSVHRIWDAVNVAYDNFCKTIPTNQLNVWLGEIRENGHTVSKGKAILRMKYVTQTATCPPQFTFFVNRPDLVNDNYERFLENRLRKSFDLTGTPIRMKFKKKD